MTEPVDHAATAERELHGTFGRYEIERLLGRGGMGAVYLARQPALDRKVVIKVITSVYDGAVERFRREARAAARIDSDNVVKVYEADEVDGTPFIAMEFVDGRSLADLLALRGRMEPAVAASIVVGALRGLRAAHDAGIVHRDVKPGNILLSRDGRVKVADFGLAKSQPGPDGKASTGGLTKPGITVGSPAYMAPEQATGDPVDGRADVYAIGLTLYELLTGTLPFPTSGVEALTARMIEDPAPPRSVVPTLSPAFDAVCLALLAREPADRPTSKAALEMLEPLAGTKEDAVALVAPVDPQAVTRIVAAKASPAPPGARTVTAAPREIRSPPAATTRAPQSPLPRSAKAALPARGSPRPTPPRGSSGELLDPWRPSSRAVALSALAAGAILVGAFLLAWFGPENGSRERSDSLARAQETKPPVDREHAVEQELQALEERMALERKESEDRERALREEKERFERDRLLALARASATASPEARPEPGPSTQAAAATPRATDPVPDDPARREAEKREAEKREAERREAEEQERKDAPRKARERLVEAIAGRSASKVASARSEIDKGPVFPEIDAFLTGARLAERLVRVFEERVASLPARSRPDANAKLSDVMKALADQGSADGELRSAATLVAAASKAKMVPGVLFVPKEGRGAQKEPGRLVERLGLEYPRPDGPPDGSRPPRPDDDGGPPPRDDVRPPR